MTPTTAATSNRRMVTLVPGTRVTVLMGIALVALALVVVACSNPDRPTLVDASNSATTVDPGTVPLDATAAPDPSAAPGVTATPDASLVPAEPEEPELLDAAGNPIAVSADGRYRPEVGDEPATIAAQITSIEQALRSPDTAPEALPDLGHHQQVIYRHLGRHPEWDDAVLAAVPEEFHPSVIANVNARREFQQMRSSYSGTVPAWQIIEPEPAEALLGYYREAEAISNIEWEYLAAINLVETGMGRILGLSTADAQGPMQFIEATWADWGEGDVNDPRDSILAAARYLSGRGGSPGDMAGALWAYNQHENYVNGVTFYAELMKADPDAFLGLYHWEIHFMSSAGDLWLPVGYDYAESTPIEQFLADHPEAAPPPGGWVPPG